MANQRIKYSSIPSNFVDGKILNAEDLNKIIRFTVAGINANKEDLDKLLSGKYNSHVFYSLSELTPDVGVDGDYAFIFFSDEISGPNRDTLKAYKKELNVWNELGDLSLISLYDKHEGLKNAYKEETRQVGETIITYENGVVVSMLSDNVVEAIEYDINGEVNKVTSTYADGKVYEETYTKDVNGNITKIMKVEVI